MLTPLCGKSQWQRKQIKISDLYGEPLYLESIPDIYLKSNPHLYNLLKKKGENDKKGFQVKNGKK